VFNLSIHDLKLKLSMLGCYCHGSKSQGVILIQNVDVHQLDGFALNVGDSTQDFVRPALGYLFGYAAYRGFKLYISMDLYAAGDACYQHKTSCKNVCQLNSILANKIQKFP